jgi:hypothetical protein
VPPIKTSNIPGPPDHFNRANRQKLADFCFAEVNPTLVKFPEGITKQIVSIKNLGTASLRFKVEVTDKNALAVAYEHGPVRKIKSSQKS